MQEADRRQARRVPVNVFFNQYVDGIPHLCELVELSMSGALVRRVSGTESHRASYALELAADAVDGEADRRLWLCAAPVWQHGRYEALRFVSPSRLDHLKLADLIERSTYAQA